jgi:hypothetical protein
VDGGSEQTQPPHKESERKTMTTVIDPSVIDFANLSALIGNIAGI